MTRAEWVDRLRDEAKTAQVARETGRVTSIHGDRACYSPDEARELAALLSAEPAAALAMAEAALAPFDGKRFSSLPHDCDSDGDCVPHCFACFLRSIPALLAAIRAQPVTKEPDATWDLGYVNDDRSLIAETRGGVRWVYPKGNDAFPEMERLLAGRSSVTLDVRAREGK